MLSEDFKLYAETNVQLARSLILKSETTANKMNNHLISLGKNVDLNDPTTWRYYVNTDGEYHAEDVMMVVTSSDDKTLINFDKATLTNHPLTRLDYTLGGRFYKELVARYPENEYLINRIIDPIPKAEAIAASDHEILGYNKNLLGKGETNLIEMLQEWIYNFASRWDNKDFNSTDAYYATSFYGVLFMSLPSVIMNIRLENAHTKYVGDYHLWSYLGDHYDLDRYRDVLSHKQALWLYRNIVDIQRNTGKHETLASLYENLALPNSLDLTKLDVIQDKSPYLATGKHRPTFTITSFTDDVVDLTTDRQQSSLDTLEDTYSKGLLNEQDGLEDSETLFSDTQMSLYSHEQSGLFKVEPVSNGIGTALDKIRAKLGYWLYLSSAGIYNPNITIPIPGRVDMVLSAADAATLFLYTVNAASDIELEEIPAINVDSVYALSPPPFATLRGISDPDVVLDSDITAALSEHPIYTPITSLPSFEIFIDGIVATETVHRFMWEGKVKAFHQSQARDMIAGLFSFTDIQYQPAGTRFNDWFGTINFDKYGLTQEDFLTISLNILKETAGISIETNTLSNVQKSITEIMDILTSYNILFVTSEGNDNFFTIVHQTPLPDVQVHSSKDDIYVPTANVQVDTVDGSEVYGTDIEDIPINEADIIVEDVYTDEADLEVGLNVEMLGDHFEERDIISPTHYVSDVELIHLKD